MQQEDNVDQSNDQPWRLTIFFDFNRYETIDFDSKPDIASGTKIVSYRGSQQGHQYEANINMDIVALWTLEVISTS